jgi:NAD(P)-dependent dehydrogenase (short-subunit alcohol dehydrogenase family)
MGSTCDTSRMVARIAVTGAGRGLGHELVKQYLARGFEVHAGCRSDAAAHDLTAQGAIAHLLDVAKVESINQFSASVQEHGPLDVLVNNAGTDARAFGAGTDHRGPFELSGDHFLEQMRVNALGPMLVTRSLLPALREARPGKVVNLTSQLGSFEVGRHASYDIGYNASKAALNMITARMAAELPADEVIVVAVHPGWVRTDMGGPDASESPEDAGRALVELIDSLGTESSGLFLRADGSQHPW